MDPRAGLDDDHKDRATKDTLRRYWILSCILLHTQTTIQSFFKSDMFASCYWFQNHKIFDTVFTTTVYVTYSKTVNFTAVRLKKKSCIKYDTENRPTIYNTGL
jgi:hypothetical protein